MSVRKPGDPLGTRCEIKNVNSIRFIGQAIEVEARRQIDIIEDGGKIDQETRLFDPGKGETRSMRSKEEAHDYRYFPDPDLLPLELEQGWVDDLAKHLPELRMRSGRASSPIMAYRRMMRACLSRSGSELTISRDTYGVAAGKVDPKTIANWIINEVLGRINKDNENIANENKKHSGPPRAFLTLDTSNAGLRRRMWPFLQWSVRAYSRLSSPDVFEIQWREGGDPAEIVEARGIKQVTDTGAIEKAVDEILAANPDKAEQAKLKPNLLGWFVGQVMKSSGGKANPAAVNEILKKKLGIE